MTNAILNHPLISQRYFFPSKVNLPHPFWVDGDGAKLACYYHRPFPNAKTIVHFHGNGEVVGDYLSDFVPAVEQLGYNCFLAEYRGYGMSTGIPALETMLNDAERIITATGQPPEQLILLGRSVGSIYAIHAASHFPNIAGLIIESGIADPLERLLLRVTPQELGVSYALLQTAVEQSLNHQAKLARYKGSTLIMHTRHDGLVDVSHGERLYAWANQPKAIQIFERGNHNSILFANYQTYFQTIQKFVATLSL
ncbi:MAG: alpha/beta hydrolase [Anaerolineae bacterium]|nr:alpha/beta hydrolase [Anaerolineae bacterium]